MPFDGSTYSQAKPQSKTYLPILATIAARRDARGYLPESYNKRLTRAYPGDPDAGRRFMTTLEEAFPGREGQYFIQQVMRPLADLDMEQARDATKRLAKRLADEARGRDPVCMEASELYHRKRLRKQFTRWVSHVGRLLRIVHSHGKERVISEACTSIDRVNRRSMQDWASKRALIHQSTGETLPMGDLITSTEKGRRSFRYALLRAMEHEGDRRDWIGFLATLTLDSGYHAAPDKVTSRNIRAWEKHGCPMPVDGNKVLQHLWKLVRSKVHRRLRKRGDKQNRLFGVWVLEPHLDGTPHRHPAGFVAPDFLEIFVEALRSHFEQAPRFQLKMRRPSSISSRDFQAMIDDLTERFFPEDLEKAPKARTLQIIDRSDVNWSTYVFKYVAPHKSDEAGDDTDAGDPHKPTKYERYCRIEGLRGFGVFGLAPVMRAMQIVNRQKEPDHCPADSSMHRAWTAARDNRLWDALDIVGAWDTLPPLKGAVATEKRPQLVKFYQTHMTWYGEQYRTLVGVAVIDWQTTLTPDGHPFTPTAFKGSEWTLRTLAPSDPRLGEKGTSDIASDMDEEPFTPFPWAAAPPDPSPP
jgi:hypothetical protein